MLSSLLLLVGLASIFLYVTPCVSDKCCEQELTEKSFEIVLENSKTRMVFCGGTLITNFYVLTAAECVYNRQPDEIHAISSIKYLSKRYDRCKVRSVDEIIVHDSYDPRDLFRNDIALLRLGRLILTQNCILDPWVSKALVAQKDEADELLRLDYPVVRLSGFGIKSENQPPASDELMELLTFASTRLYCRRMYYYRFQYNITDTQMCVFDPNIVMDSKKLHRTSDVGSSMIFKKNLIVGIALNVSDDIHPNMKEHNIQKPILFTNVSCYYDWIQSVINRYDEYDMRMKIFHTWKTS